MKVLEILSGTVHSLPQDLSDALTKDSTLLMAWNTLTSLARNEWICWVENAKLIETRQRRLGRLQAELLEGNNRPCCWPGCAHR